MTWRNSKYPKIAEMFQAKVGGKLAALCVRESDVDTLGNSLKDVLLSPVEEVRPEAVAETTEAGLEYRKVNRDVRKKMKTAKEEWTE